MLDTIDGLLRNGWSGEDSVLFEEKAIPEMSLMDLEEDLWRRLLPRDTKKPRSILRRMGVLTTDGLGAERASVAGALLCSTHPETFLPGAGIEAIRYRGVRREPHQQVATAWMTGPLDKQIRDALSFIFNEQVPKSSSQFSKRATFEAVVNAVVHRDYSIGGSNVRLHLFADRLEIYSPGALPYSMTLDSLSLRPSTRNELMVSLLGRISVNVQGAGRHQYFMERRGDGVPIILEESRRISGRDPEYRLIDDAELLLTIWSAKLPNRIELAPEIESLDA